MLNKIVQLALPKRPIVAKFGAVPSSSISNSLLECPTYLIGHYRLGSTKVNLFGINFDRRIKVNHEESIKYMESQAYKKTYSGNIVWKLYRRNMKGQTPKMKTRPSCINEEGFVNTSYPCPICRDEYLVLHRENAKLLEQFLDPYTGEIYTPKKTGLCQKQHRNLVISIIQAKDHGYITYAVPERLYNYSDYFSQDDSS